MSDRIEALSSRFECVCVCVCVCVVCVSALYSQSYVNVGSRFCFLGFWNEGLSSVNST